MVAAFLARVGVVMGWRQSISAVLEEHRAVTGATAMDQVAEMAFLTVAAFILGACVAAAMIMGGANA